MLDSISKLALKDPDLLRQANCIGGQWVQADSGKTFAVRNPSTGEVVGTSPPWARPRRAAPSRPPMPRCRPGALLAKERATILRKLFDLMLANTDDLAAIMTAEQGKPLAEAKGEVAYAASFIEWFAEEGKRIYGDMIPPNAQGAASW
jgi:succinate-semialdehyde dehydrogenase/glutarate-semialdehyde dehydrogenase